MRQVSWEKDMQRPQLWLVMILPCWQTYQTHGCGISYSCVRLILSLYQILMIDPLVLFKSRVTSLPLPFHPVKPRIQPIYSFGTLPENHYRQVILWEGFQCPFTEIHHKEIARFVEQVKALENTHIIKRAVGTPNPQKVKPSILTLSPVFLTHNYTNIGQKFSSYMGHYMEQDERCTQEVVEKLDTPVNGILVYQSFHGTWDDMVWTLKPVVNHSLHTRCSLLFQS